MKKNIYILSLLVLFQILMLSVNAYANTENLVMDPGFENTDLLNSKTWSTSLYNNTLDSQIIIDNSFSHSGNNSLKIQSNINNDARAIQTVRVEPNSYYRISCLAKTENIPSEVLNEENENLKPLGANISIINLFTTSNVLYGNSGSWQELELIGITGENQTSLTFTLGLGGYGQMNSGTVWFDNVSLIKLEKKPAGIIPAKFFQEEQSKNDSSKTSSGLGTKLLILSIVIIITVFLIFLKLYSRYSPTNDDNFLENDISSNTKINTKGYTRKKSKHQKNILVNAKPPLMLPLFKMTKKDHILMWSLTVVYMIIAFINLGSFSSPETGFTSSSRNQYFIVEFDKATTIDRISVFMGIGIGQVPKGKYTVQYLDSNNEFNDVTITSRNDNEKKNYIDKVDHLDIFTWQHFNLSNDYSPLTTTMLKFTVENAGAEFKELGFFSEETKSPITNFELTTTNIEDTLQYGSVSSLFDEQDTLIFEPTFLNNTYFDEIYHARTAYEHLFKLPPYETTHPPLGKLIISIGILIFGMVPFGWRFAGTIFGVLMVPIMYLFGKKISNNTFLAFTSGFLMMFDFMHFTQTRISTIDSFVTLFVILMYYFMYDYFMVKSYNISFKKSLVPLGLSGLFFGLGIASKWIALYGAAGLALLLFIAKIGEFIDFDRAMKKRKKLPVWTKTFIKKNVFATLGMCVVFFIIVPGIIYFTSYIPFMMSPGNQPNFNENISFSDSVANLAPIRNSKDMLNYHSNLTAQDHPYKSSWYEWPFIKKPICYYYTSSIEPNNNTSNITSMGNPAIWWFGAFAFLISGIIALIKKDKSFVPIFIAALFQYVPWILVDRMTFIYHYFSIVPFIILSIVYFFKYLLDFDRQLRYVIIIYLSIVALLFIGFYPVISGMEVSTEWIETLEWGKWNF
jgi:dolichyl-phosphate-mannose-protein mannosyltransferase